MRHASFLRAEAITVEEALQFMTINAAYALFMDDAAGRLKLGKCADLIVLSGNPLTVEPDALIDLEVLVTMVGGRSEYCTQAVKRCVRVLTSGGELSGVFGPRSPLALKLRS